MRPELAPRFVVTSVSGYSGEGGNNARFHTVFQVLDWPYCYELVIETMERKTAEKIAAQMNAGDLKAAYRRQRKRITERAREALYRSAQR